MCLESELKGLGGTECAEGVAGKCVTGCGESLQCLRVVRVSWHGKSTRVIMNFFDI